jgi:Uma2 family endonuclease
MTALTQPRMTVDEFLAWAQGRPGRYELFRGEVFEMSPEGVGHTKTKGAVYLALIEAIRKRGLACHALTDGATVRIDEHTSYEPDALVYCGQELQPTALEVPDPIIVVEVLSPSTRRIDVSRKLADYFRLPSVAHYLIFDIERRSAVHHARGSGDTLVTRILSEGTLALDPPGLELHLSDIYGA